MRSQSVGATQNPEKKHLGSRLYRWKFHPSERKLTPPPPLQSPLYDIF